MGLLFIGIYEYEMMQYFGRFNPDEKMETGHATANRLLKQRKWLNYKHNLFISTVVNSVL